MTAPPGKGNIEIAYTAISFLQVDKMQFAYRLEGFDPAWIQAGNRRSAFYTNLPPGAYCFRVIAGNGDGIWNRSGAIVHFHTETLFHPNHPFPLAGRAGAACCSSPDFFSWPCSGPRARERKLEQLV